MSEIMNSVNQRTQLVGQNRLELLLFRLNGRQKFGINVFKVREVLQCPKLTSIPKLNSYIRGIAHIRGQTISVIDMSMATGGKPIHDLNSAFVVIAEYNSSVQGFLVGAVERIINTNWEAIMPPPKGSGRASYLTAVTEFEKELIEILDVEKILNEISPISTDVSEDVSSISVENKREKIIFIADDSSVARNQVKKALSTLGLEIEMAKNGLEALNRLKALAEETGNITDKVGILVSDIEMPEMDGYTLTAEIKNNPALQDLHVVLHTSLSGVFNQAMVQKVGADDFIAKFHPDELVTSVQKWFDSK
ncbi:chemotaxis protein CheV [Paraglaciecola chathamensis]|jgi:two-component system chemotaxis response regulator CheV|uniref:Chemotaxis protein CheV n=2 Tax=Paraglaciecola chathamensis TaxID=368405 RepID=A0A8H9IB12_9ALTE|nr:MULTISPECIES: chemotaxis protein CheV [Paraglaciecola]AEE22193.1 response regulator receiver modulated CheW protein [Glaciecola sp. 4H-3-7+YE-5]MBN28032.1 chemotaxis protein CheV [Alteromonadaceae bacterium]MBJ2135983.1 chemotaxis protein CheV [Paraglaciecola chathamensis]MBU3019408.1 chemotaxis protein CheV [Paraglaciecola agarilytica]MDO6838151.1 chemotaxis protein CheV [Paraglaciecola chathamensis]|tara:strand:+ start:66213 stop:67133 length:921 start_codon:yes stop_codon:yes gene_type:complete